MVPVVTGEKIQTKCILWKKDTFIVIAGHTNFKGEGRRLRRGLSAGARGELTWTTLMVKMRDTGRVMITRRREKKVMRWAQIPGASPVATTTKAFIEVQDIL